MVIILYLMFFGTIDLLIYLLMNKVFEINWKLTSAISLMIAIAIIIHSSLFNFKSLMPLRLLLSCLEFSIGAIIIGIWGKFSIRRTMRSTRLSEKVKGISVKMGSYLFFKMPYILIFIVQCMIVFNYPNYHF
jgi:hypothetical protein